MIKLYTNRELSEKLGINLAKWKRWSREFLTPDPLGGMQSGFARQYYFSDAFNVMLGGHLVSDLHFSVYEGRRIIEGLNDWLTDNGFYREPGERPDKTSDGEKITKYKIFIQHYYGTDKKQAEFAYSIRGIISNTPIQYHGFEAKEECYIEIKINPLKRKQSETDIMIEKILNISSLYNNFIGKLGYNRGNGLFE